MRYLIFIVFSLICSNVFAAIYAWNSGYTGLCGGLSSPAAVASCEMSKRPDGPFTLVSITLTDPIHATIVVHSTTYNFNASSTASRYGDSCPSGTSFLSDGSCGCPSGQELYNGSCVALCPSESATSSTYATSGAGKVDPTAKQPSDACINNCRVLITGEVPIFPGGSNCQYFASTDTHTCYFRGYGWGTHCATSASGTTKVVTPTTVASTPTSSTTTTQQGSNGTTTSTGTESTSTSTTVNSDGSTTTTTTTTHSDGSKTITATSSGNTGSGTDGGTSSTAGSGSSSSGSSSGSGTGLANEGDDMSAGDCDPRSSNYQKCVGLLQDGPGDKGQSFIDAQNGIVSYKLNEFEDAKKSDIDSVESLDVGDPSGFGSQVLSMLPHSSSCSPLTFNYPGHTMVLPCEHFEDFKLLFGYFLYIATAIYIFHLGTKPIEVA